MPTYAQSDTSDVGLELMRKYIHPNYGAEEGLLGQPYTSQALAQSDEMMHSSISDITHLRRPAMFTQSTTWMHYHLIITLAQNNHMHSIYTMSTVWGRSHGLSMIVHTFEYFTNTYSLFPASKRNHE